MPGATERTSANDRRQAAAAAGTTAGVRKAIYILGDDIPEPMLTVARLRLAHPNASLRQLGELARPPLGKDAVAGQLRRLLIRAAAVIRREPVPAAALGQPGSLSTTCVVYNQRVLS